jgi:hypothetical protein
LSHDLSLLGSQVWPMLRPCEDTAIVLSLVLVLCREISSAFLDLGPAWSCGLLPSLAAGWFTFILLISTHFFFLIIKIKVF